jgi:hypothetical protein
MQGISAKAAHEPKAFSALVALEKWAGNLVILVLSLQIIVLAQHTFLWRYGEDNGFLYYYSWLINEHHYLPYRDLHETSFPGTFLIYGLITKLTGYSVTAYNITHMILFGFLCWASYTLLKRIDRKMAITATCLFGSYYFFMDRSMHMQREFLILILLVCALAVLTSQWQLKNRALISGVLFGFASLIKPHAAIAAPVAILLLSNPNGKLFSRETIQAAALSLLGFSCTWILTTLYLVKLGIWPNFYRMITEYLPLYQRMNGLHIEISTDARLIGCLDSIAILLFCGALSFYLIAQKHRALTILAVFSIITAYFYIEQTIDPSKNYFFLLNLPITAIATIFFCIQPKRTRAEIRLATLLMLSWPLYSLYVDIGGKNWDYHHIPENFFFCVLLSMVFVSYKATNWRSFSFRIFYLLLSTVFIYGRLSPSYAADMTCLTGNPICDTPEQQAYAYEDALEHFLRKNVKENERVEPLATSTLGPLFPALLRAGIQPSTPYLEGFPLYHDADSPYVQQIRQDMLAHLEQHPPRFMIKPVNFFAPGGAQASRFPELENYVAAHYERVNSARYPELDDKIPVIIYERKKDTP